MARHKLKSYELVVLQARALRSVRQFLAEDLKIHEMTVMEWALLGLISDHEKDGVSVTDLARMLDVKTALTSVMISKQTKNGLLTKVLSGTDSRLRYIELTPEGKQRVRGIETSLSKSLQQWLKAVEGEETTLSLTDYMKVLEVLAAAGPKSKPGKS